MQEQGFASDRTARRDGSDARNEHGAPIETDPGIPSEEFWKIARATAAFPGSDLDLSAVTAPVLVLYAENAPAGMQGMASRIPDAIPNADVELVGVPDAGHAVNLDNSEFFDGVVRSFPDGVHGDAA